ncbi:MAG: MerR family transcriptional regulator [Clostridia bacterium]|nr:MerR family transcriptional regulator [Clostridia bacterium]
MRVNEVMKITGLTKKALYYYEEEGLIHPEKNGQNNYRTYSEQDIKKLLQISVLRRLNIPLCSIGKILENPEEMRNIMKSHLNTISSQITYLEYNKNMIENLIGKMDDTNATNVALMDLENLNNLLFSEAKINAKYVQKELERVFPGTLGKIVSIQIGAFLDEPLDSKEKIDAWMGLISKLDDLEEVGYNKEFRETVDRLYGNNTDIDPVSWSDRYNKMLDCFHNGGISKEEFINAKSQVEKYISQMEKQDDFKKLDRYMLPYKPFFDDIEKYIEVLSSKFKKHKEMLNKISLNY